jgi:hypothetical protein
MRKHARNSVVSNVGDGVVEAGFRSIVAAKEDCPRDRFDFAANPLSHLDVAGTTA